MNPTIKIIKGQFFIKLSIKKIHTRVALILVNHNYIDISQNMGSQIGYIFINRVEWDLHIWEKTTSRDESKYKKKPKLKN